MRKITLEMIVGDWLMAHGVDGLCSEFHDCGCLISDLMPCGDPRPDCQAGRQIKCNCGEGKHIYHVKPVKCWPTKRRLS